MRGKSFAAIYECSCSFMLFTNTIFKTISVKEMEPNFVRMKVPELKNNLQVGESVLRISVVKNFCILISLGYSVEAREIAGHLNPRRARTQDGYFCQVGNGK